MGLLRFLLDRLPFETGGTEVSFQVSDADRSIEAVSWSDGQLALASGSWDTDGHVETVDDVARICSTSPVPVSRSAIEELWNVHRRNLDSDE